MGLKAAIFAPRGRLAMAGLTRMLDPGPDIAPGMHPMTIVIRRREDRWRARRLAPLSPSARMS
jgi:hypothetical protein